MYYFSQLSAQHPQEVMPKVKWKVKFANLNHVTVKKKATENGLMQGKQIFKKKKHGDSLHTNM